MRSFSAHYYGVSLLPSPPKPWSVGKAEERKKTKKKEGSTEIKGEKELGKPGKGTMVKWSHPTQPSLWKYTSAGSVSVSVDVGVE